MFDFDLDNFVNEINDVDTSSVEIKKPIPSTNTEEEQPKEIEQDHTTSAIDDFLNTLDTVELDTNIQANASNIQNFIDTLKVQSEESREAEKYMDLANTAARKAFETNDRVELSKSQMYLVQGLAKREEEYLKGEYDNCQKQIKKCCDNIVTLKKELENSNKYLDSTKNKKLRLWKNARIAKNNIIVWHNMLSSDIDLHQKQLNSMKKRTANAFGFEYTPSDFSNLKKLRLKLYHGITIDELNNILNNALSK